MFPRSQNVEDQLHLFAGAFPSGSQRFRSRSLRTRNANSSHGCIFNAEVVGGCKGVAITMLDSGDPYGGVRSDRQREVSAMHLRKGFRWMGVITATLLTLQVAGCGEEYKTYQDCDGHSHY